jgi:hypothetical protein
MYLECVYCSIDHWALLAHLEKNKKGHAREVDI